jgi:heme/copper-type cytochrome/quinol oxidase subunit 2
LPENRIIYLAEDLNLSEPGLFMSREKIISLAYLSFVALLAASIPVSRYMISVFQFCLAGIFILDGIKYSAISAFYKTHTTLGIILRFIPFHVWMILDGIARQFKRLANNRPFLVFLLFSFVYILGLIHTSEINVAMKVLRNKLPVFLLPLFFAAIKSIHKEQKNIILLFFVLSVTISSFISFSIFLSGNYDDIRRISPFINHIHLSIFISFSVFILFYFLKTGVFKKALKIPATIGLIWLIAFQFMILKSLTGVVILFAGIYFLFVFHKSFGIQINKFLRFTMVYIIPIVLISVLFFYVLKFYNVEELDSENLELYTAKGNPYHHDLEPRMLENGHYVFIYLSEPELMEEWNKVSSYDFDSLDQKGQELKYILIRYLTSKGLRKDAEGMQQLNEEDIRMVEEGYANHIFSSKLSLYPRIYQVIWEFDMYFKSGNPSGGSVTQRVESIRMGLRIISKHPLFGVGTGDLYSSYHQEYDESGSRVLHENRITGANQFLNFIVQFGFSGLFVILFSWLYPAIRNKAFSNPLFVVFLFIACVSMFSEEILRFQTGVTFFAYFYSFFVLLDDAPAKHTLQASDLK